MRKPNMLKHARSPTRRRSILLELVPLSQAMSLEILLVGLALGLVNGRIPSRLLKPLPGKNAGMLKGYAYAYWRLHYKSLRSGGPSLAIYDGQVGRTFRTIARQQLAKAIYGANAAAVGFSNHGLARAVDLMNRAQRWAVDKWGAAYGIAKRWSDASWEWWHMRPIRTFGSPGHPDKRDTHVLTDLESKVVGKFYYHSRRAAEKSKLSKAVKAKDRLWATYFKGWLIGRRRRLKWSAERKGGWKPNDRGARHLVIHRVLSGWTLDRVRKEGANPKVKT